jgi:hypothetical protein
MRIKLVHVLLFLIIGVSLAGCGVSESERSELVTIVASSVVATQTAQAQSLAPTAAMPSDTALDCPAPVLGTKLFKAEDASYCFLYPEGHGVASASAGEVQIAPGEPPYIGSFGAFTLNVQGTDGRTAEQSADTVAAELNCSGDRYNMTLANEQAVVLSECKGQDETRKVFVAHADSLYTLTFIDLSERFYAQVITSFTFLR